MIAPAKRPATVRVSALGRLRCSAPDRPERTYADLPALMLAYLAVERSTDVVSLARLFYPDQGRAEACAAVDAAVRVIDARVGGGIGRPAAGRLELDGRIQCDVHAFVDDVRRGQYARAVARYGGSFLDGISIGRSERLRAWVEGWRGRLSELHVRAVHRRALLDTAESVGIGAAFVDRTGRLVGANGRFGALCPVGSRSRIHVIEQVRLRLAGGLHASGRARVDARLVVAVRVLDGDDLAVVQVRDEAVASDGAGDLGELGLTPAQERVARGLAAGLANRTIARRLGVSEHTARRHTEQIFVKLGVSSRAEAAVRLVSTG